MNDSPRILIIRTSALGDIVHALPVLTALRKEIPEAHIGWVVEEAFAPLLSGHPALNTLLSVNLRGWRRRPYSPRVIREFISFLSALGSFSAEIVLDLMGNHKAGVLAALTLGDRRIGHRAADRRERSSAVWISEPVTASGAHVVDRMLSVLAPLGIETPNPSFGADQILEQEPVAPVAGDDEPFLLLHPATGWANKDYPADRWGTVAASLHEETGVAVRIAPGPGEQGVADEVARSAGGSLQVLPPLPLPQLVYLQRRARLVLGGDTGPVHLAHALGTPVVCVMGPTDPERNGPYGGEAEAAVYHRLPCSFCHRRLGETKACLLEITPETIVSKSLARLRERCV